MATTIKYSELNAWLASQVENTVDTPYEIIVTELTDADLEGGRGNTLSSYKGLQKVLIDNSTKYVAIKDLQGSVTTISRYAFYKCTSLTSIEIPNGVTSIGNESLENCTSLTSVIIPDSVTSIGYSIFLGCTSLTSVVIGNSVASISNMAFYNCRSLTSVVIPDSVTSIETQAFDSCSSLTSIIIPNGVTSIGESAFYNCTSLKSIKIYGNLTTSSESFISVSAGFIVNPEVWTQGYPTNFGGATSSIFYDFDGNILTPITPATLSSCLSFLPENTVDTPYEIIVTELTNDDLIGAPSSPYAGLQKVLIDNPTKYVAIKDLQGSVTSIGNKAFAACTSLTSIIIPNSVTSIDERAFAACTSLTSIEIPDSVTSIGNYAFSYCNSLTSIVIPNGVTSIGSSAFADCTSLASIVIPNGVTSIGGAAFAACTSLTSIIIPESVTSIGNEAFYDCSSLTSIVIPSGIASIVASTFFGCSSLTSIEIPDSVASIGDYAFYNCSSLTSILYGGSEIQWAAISKGRSWNSSVPSTMVITYSYIDLEKVFNGMVTQYNYTTSTVQTLFMPIKSKGRLIIKWYVTNASGDIKYELTGCNDVSIMLTNKKLGTYYYLVEATKDGETKTSPVIQVDIDEINIAGNEKLRVYGSANILGTLSGPTIDGILARLDALER